MSDQIMAEVEADEVTQVSIRPAAIDNIDTEAGPKSEQGSAKPLVVRTLKPPPEIWDMVHEAPEHFNPGGAFVARLTSSKTNLVLLTLTVMLISGLGAYAIMTLSDGRGDGTRDGAAAQVQEEPGTTQTAPTSQANVESVPASAVDEPEDAQLSTSPSTEYSADNTQLTDSQPTDPEPKDPRPTDQDADDPVAANHAVTSSVQPTGVSVSNISRQASSGAAGALSGIKRVIVAPGGQNADRSRAAGRESETAAAPDASAAPQKPQAPHTPQTADIKRSDEQSAGDSTAAKKRSDTTSSPQASAPPATSSAPKAKVIQWP